MMPVRRESLPAGAVQLATGVFPYAMGTAFLRSYMNCVSDLLLGGKGKIGEEFTY